MRQWLGLQRIARVVMLDFWLGGSLAENPNVVELVVDFLLDDFMALERIHFRCGAGPCGCEAIN